jgi:hypothetical protein
MAELSQGYGKAMAELWQEGSNAGGKRFYIVFNWQIRQGTGFDRNAFFKKREVCHKITALKGEC